MHMREWVSKWTRASTCKTREGLCVLLQRSLPYCRETGSLTKPEAHKRKKGAGGGEGEGGEGKRKEGGEEGGRSLVCLSLPPILGLQACTMLRFFHES